MQIPILITSSLYYITVVLWRPEFGALFFIVFLFKYKQFFNENIINNHSNHKNYITTMHQPYSPYLTVLVKNYIPCQGGVWCTYRLPGTFYVPLGFGVVLFAKVFFLPVQFWKAVHFTLALLYPNFKLQYLMNCSSDFNNFCRFQY